MDNLKRILLIFFLLIIPNTLDNDLILRIQPTEKILIESLKPITIPDTTFYIDPIKIKYSKSDYSCFLRTIYYEAGDEPELGKYAVGQVILNRLKMGYGKSICDVVKSPGQFTNINRSSYGEFWENTKIVADDMLNNNKRLDIASTSLYFHSQEVKPTWIKYAIPTFKIGTHIFYTLEKGFNEFK